MRWRVKMSTADEHPHGYDGDEQASNNYFQNGRIHSVPDGTTLNRVKYLRAR